MSNHQTRQAETTSHVPTRRRTREARDKEWPRKLTAEDVRTILRRVARGKETYAEIAEGYDVTARAIGLIATRKRWAGVTLPPGIEDRLAAVVKRRAVLQGQDHPNSLLSNDDVERMRRLASDGASTRELAEMFPVQRNTVQNIVAGRSWRGM